MSWGSHLLQQGVSELLLGPHLAGLQLPDVLVHGGLQVHAGVQTALQLPEGGDQGPGQQPRLPAHTWRGGEHTAQQVYTLQHHTAQQVYTLQHHTWEGRRTHSTAGLYPTTPHLGVQRTQ